MLVGPNCGVILFLIPMPFVCSAFITVPYIAQVDSGICAVLIRVEYYRWEFQLFPTCRILTLMLACCRIRDSPLHLSALQQLPAALPFSSTYCCQTNEMCSQHHVNIHVCAESFFFFHICRGRQLHSRQDSPNGKIHKTCAVCSCKNQISWLKPSNSRWISLRTSSSQN